MKPPFEVRDLSEKMDRVDTWRVLEGDVAGIVGQLLCITNALGLDQGRGFVVIEMPYRAIIDGKATLDGTTKPGDLVVGTGDCVRLGVLCHRYARRFLAVVPDGAGEELRRQLAEIWRPA